MPNAEDDDVDTPELNAEWFRTAVQPHRGALRRGNKRAVFVEDAIARRFGSDEELEEALRALLQAAEHVRQTG
jgi:hypothetical protein